MSVDLFSVAREATTPTTAPEPKTLLEIEQDKTRQLYKEYQDNIRRSEMARSEILKGLQTGIPLPDILLIAIDAIGILTGDAMISPLTAEYLKTVYGYAFRDKDCLRIATDEIRSRLQLLEQAEREATPAEKKTIQRAILAHQEELARYN